MRPFFFVCGALALVACSSDPSPITGSDAGLDATSDVNAPVPDGGVHDAAIAPEADAHVDASDAGSDAGTSVYVGIKLSNNELCLPTPLSTGANGLAECRVILGVPGSCDSSEGLSQATPADVTGINALAQSENVTLPSGSLCVLAQVAGSSNGVGCAAGQASAWCYVKGSCVANVAHPCKQAICNTPQFESDFGKTNDAGFLTEYWGSWSACP